MKIENRFGVPVPASEAWQALLDVERVAGCLPGATLTTSDGDTHTGTVKVKLGPIALTYQGSVTFVSTDEAAGVVVLEASGRETRGNGTAKALITCRLVATDAATDVHVETDLAITGKPAQFGRGALADVAGKLLDQFAANLAAQLTAAPSSVPEAEPGAPTPARTEPAPATRPVAADAVDLLQIAPGAGALRIAAIALPTLAVGFLLGRLVRRSRR